jgi:hypothetical protein
MQQAAPPRQCKGGCEGIAQIAGRRADAREDKMEANYKVAKEKCDALSQREGCVHFQRKMKYHQ